MTRNDIDPSARIERIEWASLPGRRPRPAGCNARLGKHGQDVGVSLARVTGGGVSGFGWSRISQERAGALVGGSLRDAFDVSGRVRPEYRALELPLLDWLGRLYERPVYALVAGTDVPTPLSVPCYDTSLYFDDLDAADDAQAVRIMQAEAREGWARGHRAFKIKVGRGARHMPLEAGLQRDIAVIRGVRAAVGAEAPIMIDINNGYNLNLTKALLDATRAVGVFWVEEPFHEDPVLYQDLKAWLNEQHLATLIADGEGDASPALLDFAKSGRIDVVQYDLCGYGFCKWLELGETLDAAGIKSAPHNYGNLFGNYAACHIAPAIAGFVWGEWDEAQAPGLDTSGYAIVDGKVQVPDAPGFGLGLDETRYVQRVRESGWSVG